MDVRGLHSYVTGIISPEKNKLHLKTTSDFREVFPSPFPFFFPTPSNVVLFMRD